MRRLAPLAAALLLSACGAAREAGRAVRAYDEALVRAYKLNDPAGLSKVATAAEVRRLAALIDLKVAARLVLESTLEELEVVRAEAAPGGRSAAVETRERWRYFDRRLAPGQPPGPVFVAAMRMHYELVREGGTLKVREVRTLSNEYLQGGAPAPPRGHGATPDAGAAPP